MGEFGDRLRQIAQKFKLGPIVEIGITPRGLRVGEIIGAGDFNHEHYQIGDTVY